MMPYLTAEYGNPGAIYSLGRKAKDAVENARSQVANLFGCKEKDVIFTSGGSEGNNMVLRGLTETLNLLGSNEIAVSEIEHDSILNTARMLHKDRGINIRYIKPDSFGHITPESVMKEASFDSGHLVGLLSVMYVNNETGVVNDIPAISREFRRIADGYMFDGCRYIHSDCVQAAGNFDINVDKLNVDYATISSHKIHGPKGVGALYARYKCGLSPIITGGHEQEFGFRGGTENVPGIVGFGKACEMAYDNLAKTQALYNTLKDSFITVLMSRLGEDSVAVNGDNPGIGKTISVWIKGVDAQSLILMLSDLVCLSAGSACTSHSSNPSHVLKAMGFPDDRCGETIRVSFSDMNSIDDVVRAASLIANAVTLIRLGVPHV